MIQKILRGGGDPHGEVGLEDDTGDLRNGVTVIDSGPHRVLSISCDDIVGMNEYSVTTADARTLSLTWDSSCSNTNGDLTQLESGGKTAGISPGAVVTFFGDPGDTSHVTIVFDNSAGGESAGGDSLEEVLSASFGPRSLMMRTVSTVYEGLDGAPGVSVSQDSWRDPTVGCNQITQTATFYTGAAGTSPSWLNINDASGCVVETNAPERSGHNPPATYRYNFSSGHSATITRISNGHTLTVVWGERPVPAGPSLSPESRNITVYAGSAMTPTTAMTATGFSSSPTYTIAPALPAGLSINPSNGVISGTPTATMSARNYVITGTAGGQSATATVTITVSGPALDPASQTRSTVVNTLMTATTPFTANGFSTTPTYTISPALPSGLSFNTSNGVISGTPTSTLSPRQYDITATAGSDSATATVVLTVTAPTLTPASATVTGFVDTAITPTAVLSPTGFTSSPGYTVSPTLPDGLSLNSSSGVISGTPTTAVSNQQFTITGSAGGLSASATVTITINPPPTTILPGLVQIQGAPNFVLELDCNAPQTGNPVLNIPHYPGGSLEIRTTGSCNRLSTARFDSGISGTIGVVYVTGGSNPTVRVHPNTRYERGTSPNFLVFNYYFATRPSEPLGLRPSTQTRITSIGADLAQTNPITADGFSSSPTFSVSPDLPAGISIDPETGVISGTAEVLHPTTTHTITATANGVSATASVTITVAALRVSFSGNGTTTNVSFPIFVQNEGGTLTLPNAPTRTNHGFTGWFTSPTDPNTKVGDAGGDYTPLASVLLFAQWIPPYVVTYNSQGGASRTASNVIPGNTLTFTTNPTRTGFTFAGWFDASCQGNPVSAPFTPTGNTTLYAQWNRTISFNRQHNSFGADPSPASIVVNMNSVSGCTGASPALPTITLPTITRPGHRLSGWFSAASGGTKYGDAGATYTVPTTGTSATISMNAQWSTLADVNFDLRGGTITDPNCFALATPGSCRITWGVGDPAFILPNVTSDADLTFDGWFVNSSGGTPVGQAGDVLNSPSSQTLRAQWTGTRTYDPNGGTVSVPSVTAKTGVSVSIPLPYRPGYAFDGWIASNPPFGPRNVSRQQTSLTMDKTETWTAQWRQFPDAPVLQSGSLSEDRRIITLQFSGDLQNLYGTNPSCSDFQVVSTPKDANFDDKATGRTCTFDGSTVMITRNLDDELSPDSTSLTVAYVGRSLAAANDAAAFVHQSDPIVVSNVVPTWTMTFDYQDAGLTNVQSVSIPRGSAVDFPATPTRPGFIFLGWFEEITSGARVDNLGTPLIPDSSLTLYAQWQVVVTSTPTGPPARPIPPRGRPSEIIVPIISVTPATVVAAPVFPRPPAAPAPVVPQPAPAPAPQQPAPAPEPRSGSVLQRNLGQSSGTVDLGGGLQPSASANGGNSQRVLGTPDVARRSVQEKRDEVLTGFAPSSTTEIEVVGARTGARFVLSTQVLGNKEQVAQAISTSAVASSTNFFEVKAVEPVSQPSPGPQWSPEERDTVSSLFTSSGLGEPTSLSDFDVSGFTEWVRVDSQAKTYVPGSTVYLALTSEPIVIAQATVNASGDAELSGTIPAELLTAGEHRIRVIGIRLLDGVSVDEDGNVQVTDEVMAEIQRFDQGTQVTVAVLGTNPDGETHTSLRVVDLVAEVRAAWWTLWLILGVFGLFVLARTRGLLGQPIRRYAGLGVVAASALPAVIVGIASAATGLVWWGIGAGLLALVLAFLTPHGEPEADIA